MERSSTISSTGSSAAGVAGPRLISELPTIRSVDGDKCAYQDLAGNLALQHAVHAVLPSMIVILVGEGVLMALVSLRPAAL